MEQPGDAAASGGAEPAPEKAEGGAAAAGAPAAAGGGNKTVLLVVGGALLALMGLCCVGGALWTMLGGSGGRERQPPSDETPAPELLRKVIEERMEPKGDPSELPEGAAREAATIKVEEIAELKERALDAAKASDAVAVKILEAEIKRAGEAMGARLEAAAGSHDGADAERLREMASRARATDGLRMQLSKWLESNGGGSVKATPLAVERSGETMIQLYNDNCYDWTVDSIEIAPYELRPGLMVVPAGSYVLIPVSDFTSGGEAMEGPAGYLSGKWVTVVTSAGRCEASLDTE